MATQMITLKLDDKFLKEIDSIVKKENYQNRTEFIRNSLREGVDKERLKEGIRLLTPLRGASGKKTTDEEIRRVREKVFNQLNKDSNNIFRHNKLADIFQ